MSLWRGAFVLGLCLPSVVFAADDASSFFDLSLDNLLSIDVEEQSEPDLVLYGFIRTNVEQVFHEPGLDGKDIVYEDSPPEWSFPGARLFGLAHINERVIVRFNLGGDADGVGFLEANANLEVSEGFQIRTGPKYRRFGLFNEKLDQFPTFLGIEPPELLDKDHLLLPRTSIAAVHGEIPVGGNTLMWSAETGNSEAGAEKGVFPVSVDLRLKTSNAKIGVSGYLSSVLWKQGGPDRGVGEGSPRGGVMPWMAGDRYFVVGPFAEVAAGQLLIQSAYWLAHHDAVRDPDSVAALLAAAELSDPQVDRFTSGGNEVTYDIHSFYTRLGYTIDSDVGSWTPYAFADFMQHPETIANKDYGGDAESGVADNGSFWKPSLGVVYKPDDSIAIKADTSVHVQEFAGQVTQYPEVRLDFSYAFKAAGK